MKKSLKTIKTIVIMLLCLSMIFCNIAFASEAPDEKGIDTAYEFPITPASESWNKLTTINDKIAACQIPNDILLNLTTSALIETVSNYPLAVNLYAYDTLKQGYDKVKEQFNGLAELERRFINAPAETEKALESFIQSSKRTASSEDFRVYYMARIIQGVKATTTHGELRYTSAYVYTPNGSAVSAFKDLTWSDHGFTQSEANAAHNQVQYAYSSVTILRSPSPKYNCHSYAWYSTSTSNSYWIYDPSTYIQDGSYSRVYNYYVGAKLLYGTPGSSPEHSAIITGVSENHLTYVKSKWGALGLYEHLYYDCPYSSGVKSYR